MSFDESTTFDKIMRVDEIMIFEAVLPVPIRRIVGPDCTGIASSWGPAFQPLEALAEPVLADLQSARVPRLKDEYWITTFHFSLSLSSALLSKLNRA